MAKAIASGKATTPTMTPAVKSARSCWREYDFRVVNSFGISTGGSARMSRRQEMAGQSVPQPGATASGAPQRRGGTIHHWRRTCPSPVPPFHGRLMRIALVTEFYYPHLGGVTEHVHNLALAFQRLGHEVIVVTADMGDATHDGPFVRRIGKSRVIYSSGSFARVTTGWRLRARLRYLFRNERIHIVNTHGPLATTLGLSAPAAAKDLDLPVVGTFNSWFPHS